MEKKKTQKKQSRMPGERAKEQKGSEGKLILSFSGGSPFWKAKMSRVRGNMLIIV